MACSAWHYLRRRRPAMRALGCVSCVATLTSALGRRASLTNREGKVRDWRSLLVDSQSRRLFYYQSKRRPRDVAVCGAAQYTIVYASQLPRASCPWCTATATIKRVATQTAARMGRCTWCCSASPSSSSRSCRAWRSVNFVSIIAPSVLHLLLHRAILECRGLARKEWPVAACRHIRRSAAKRRSGGR